MFQQRTLTPRDDAHDSHDRFPREKITLGLLLCTAIFFAGFIAGYDYKPEADKTPAAPSQPTQPANPADLEVKTTSWVPVTNAEPAPLPKLAPVVVTAAAPLPTLVAPTPIAAAKVKGTPANPKAEFPEADAKPRPKAAAPKTTDASVHVAAPRATDLFPGTTAITASGTSPPASK